MEEQARDVRKEGTLKDEERRNFECGGHKRRGNMLGASSTAVSDEERRHSPGIHYDQESYA